MNIKRLYVLMSSGIIIFSGMHVGAFSFSKIKNFFCGTHTKTKKHDLDRKLIKNRVVKIIPILQDIVEMEGKSLTSKQQNEISHKEQMVKDLLEKLYDEYLRKQYGKRNNYFDGYHRVRDSIWENKINELTDPWDFLEYITFFFRAARFTESEIDIKEIAKHLLIAMNRLNQII